MLNRVSLLLLVACQLGADLPASPRDGLLRADELFAEEKLFEAERLYDQALSLDVPEQRRRAYDHLLIIYQKLPRLDAIIRVGERYRTWLLERGDDERYHEVGVDVGRAYLSLGYQEKGGKLLEDSLRVPSLSPSKRIQALNALGQAAQKRGDAKAAEKSWEEVDRFALIELRGNRFKNNRRLQIEYVWSLAECYRARKLPEKGIEYLKELLPIHEQLDDERGMRETLRILADHYRLAKQLAQAEKCLTLAIQLHNRQFKNDVVISGSLALDLSEILHDQKKFEAAAEWRDKGISLLRSVLVNPDAKQHEVAGALAAFSRLQGLYITSSEYGKALQLTATKNEEWESVSLVQPRMKFEQGSLELILGAYQDARGQLRASVFELEIQSPQNLIDYPRALNHLALVELATGEAKRAQGVAEKTLEVYRKNHLPPDAIHVDAYNLIGTSLAQQGDYPEAIKKFRAGIGICDQVGSSVAEQRGSLLLNIALLLKAQSDLGGAMRYCELAIEAFEKIDQDSLAVVALQAALANMHATNRRYDLANDYAKKILDVCRRKEIERGPLVVAARHCQALFHLKQREFAEADRIWTEVLRMQEQEPGSILLPRTLNYLGICREMQNQLSSAEAIYRRAEKIQRANPRAFPVTHFITLWGLANVLDRQEGRKEAKEKLLEALALAEKGRLRIYGDSHQRAEYFSQFATAFETLVDWSIRDGDLPGALVAASRSRGRNLLDHLEMANLDPRDSLTGPEGKRLVAQETALLQRISAIRAQVQLIPPSSILSAEARKLLKEYDDAEKQYAEVYREILNASPLYRNFLDDEMTPATLRQMQDEVLGTTQVLLAYHIGRDRSHVFLLGGPGTKLEVYPLTLPKNVAEKITTPDPFTTGEVLRGARGLVLRKKSTGEVPLPESPKFGEPTELTQSTARAMIDHYRVEISDESFLPSRGMVLKAKDPTKPIPTQRPDLVGNVFLPPALLQRLRELKPRNLIVIPDGPLHKLPLEAMVLESGEKPRYGLDELPPIVYCPSASILMRLAKRPAVQTGERTLLTLSNPSYPQVDPKEELKSEAEQALVRFGRLPLLEGSGRESELIAQYFPARSTVSLSGPQATEGNFLKAVRGKNIVHLAAHGFADDRFGNLFGAVALAPPRKGSPARADDDAFLSLFEIYRLPLQDCELAVLSACVTNVGPQQPLEAGVTLASGFLSAGSRRVVASHWNVNDQATCDLMNTFFEGITRPTKDGKPISFCEALQTARKKVREDSHYRSPYYWAPFVIIGPGE